jgi:hypothetical protein
VESGWDATAAVAGKAGASSSAAADSLIKIAAINAEVTTKAQRRFKLMALPTVSFRPDPLPADPLRTKKQYDH